MIYVKLMGGLGNQMFQYAAGRRLAAARGTSLVLDDAWFSGEGRGADTPRRYELDCFAASPERADARGLARALRPARPWRCQPVGVVKEPSFRFDPAILDLPDRTYLDGYWQCARYFDDAAPLVRADFRFRSPATGRNADLLAEVGSVVSVGVHVRRADYVTSPAASAFHGLAPAEYYERAVSAIASEVADARFFVFSDDPQWCRAELRWDLPTTFVDHNPPDRGCEDLRLLSACRHAILANSSFSWWGAWLGDHPGKRVYAPRRWFADPSIDTRDIPCPQWVLL